MSTRGFNNVAEAKRYIRGLGLLRETSIVYLLSESRKSDNLEQERYHKKILYLLSSLAYNERIITAFSRIDAHPKRYTIPDGELAVEMSKKETSQIYKKVLAEYYKWKSEVLIGEWSISYGDDLSKIQFVKNIFECIYPPRTAKKECLEDKLYMASILELSKNLRRDDRLIFVLKKLL